MSSRRTEESVRHLLGMATAQLLTEQGYSDSGAFVDHAELEADWQRWLTTLFPDTFSTFAPHHVHFWDWIWSLQRGVKPDPFVGIWPRGGGKSTNAETACIAIGALNLRSYILYVSGSQGQADDHVQNIGALLEGPSVARYYPQMANRRVGKYGNPRGWRHNRLRTASGLTIDSIGMDTAHRGMKLEEERPDFIIVDDVDQEHDTRTTTLKKIRRLTHSLLPAGSQDAAEVFIQNLVLPEGLFARLAGVASEPADFLLTREVSGPHPAIRDLQYVIHDHGQVEITGGVPTWDGMDLNACQDMLDSMGLEAFLSECQHHVRRPGQIVYHREWWEGGRARYDSTDELLLRTSTAARFIHIDTAHKDADSTDYTSMAVFDLTHDRRLRLRDVYRRRLEFPELVTETERFAAKWNMDGMLHEITVEDKGSGTSLLQTLRATADPLVRRRLIAWMPRGSKEERARLTAPWCRMALVELPFPHTDLRWLTEFESELYAFPMGIYDDQVDSFAQGILYNERWLEAGHQSRLRKGAG